jgi:hypothetical protein
MEYIPRWVVVRRLRLNANVETLRDGTCRSGKSRSSWNIEQRDVAEDEPTDTDHQATLAR